MSKRLLPLTAFCLLLLPSCVLRSNIGHNIREAGELCTSVSLRPVNDTIYMTPGQRKASPGVTTAYARLPEVTFRCKSHCFAAHSYQRTCEDIRPTGKVRTALVACQGTGCPYNVKAFVEEIPANARASTPTELPEAQIIHDERTLPHTQTSWGRRLAAAPFDYLIDPVLTVGLTASGGIIYVALAPFVGIHSACRQQQQAKLAPLPESLR